MNKVSTILPLENWTGYRFGLIASRLGSFISPMYEDRYELTMPAWRSLAVIARHQPLTATQLATLTSSDAFKVARSIELLVRRGLIHRDVDKADRRRASLSLTTDGRKVYKDIEKFVVPGRAQAHGRARSARSRGFEAKPRQARSATGDRDQSAGPREIPVTVFNTTHLSARRAGNFVGRGRQGGRGEGLRRLGCRI
ncbi:DNA-binding MarR family transcriptional regulator [Bradyrhizobium sp. i1.4.4]